MCVYCNHHRRCPPSAQVSNTDAEGRLVLADCLDFVAARHRPHTIVDLATLTGAVVVGLGDYSAGIFSNRGPLARALVASGAACGERLWPMPIMPEHAAEISTGAAHADLKSTGASRQGGSCTAAAFLHSFIGRGGSDAAPVAWAHIDLAGPAMYSKARGMMCAGGTGFGSQTISRFLAYHAPGSGTRAL